MFVTEGHELKRLISVSCKFCFCDCFSVVVGGPAGPVSADPGAAAVGGDATEDRSDGSPELTQPPLTPLCYCPLCYV